MLRIMLRLVRSASILSGLLESIACIAAATFAPIMTRGRFAC